MKGCYDEQFGAGMQLLGGPGTGGGGQAVQLVWKTLISDGEIVGQPAMSSDDSVIVASARGTLNKVTQNHYLNCR